MTELLAKSPRGEHRVTLLEHTRDVMDAAEALFGDASGPTRLGECWLRFFRILEVPWAKFHDNLLAACGLHDWGKANDGFQNAMERRGQQAIRHEHFSTLLVAQPACWSWLEQEPDFLDREVILSAVLTHHLKAAFSVNRSYTFGESVNRGAWGFRSAHRSEAFADVVRLVAGRIGLPPPDLSSMRERWTFDTDVVPEVRQANLKLNKLTRDLNDNAPRRRFLHAVRAALIAADAAGSGLRRTQNQISDWISAALTEHRPLTADEINDSVIRGRVDSQKATGRWIDKGDGKDGWNDFQLACDSLPGRALLLAPCGSGKTLAAWRWIAAQLTARTAGHVLFLYPTRATATEGFRDYVSWAPEAEAALMHGTSKFDLEDMFENPPEGDARKGRTFSLSEAEQRLFALGYWGRRAFSATVDQFLAFLQYGYGSVCMLPVLADSVVVIDEVHSFDANMWTALKKFLTEFDVPVLCMTATLTNERRDELVSGCGLKLYEDRPGNLATIAGGARYRLRRASSRDEADAAVREALAAGKRVLWVVNQVKRAHAVVARFAKELPTDVTDAALATADGVPVYCYHSRFKLTDRVNRHNDLMRSLKFSKTAGPALGVTTQVCEMSLDIDVDLLVTEDCPVTALVQRMGRCNRAHEPRKSAGDVLVYKPKEDTPYNAAQLTGLPQFLDLVKDRELSQADLEDALRQMPALPSNGDPLCSFVASGPYAVAGEEEFRDSEEFNRPCVLPGDIDAYLKPDARKPGFVLPVPRKFADGRDNDISAHAKLDRHVGVCAARAVSRGRRLLRLADRHAAHRLEGRLMGKARVKPAPPAVPTAVTVTYDLSELPTAQHKAGLAGLLFQIDHMNDKTPKPAAIPQVLALTATSATIEFTKESVQCLFDDVYAADVNGEWFRTKKAKEELRGERTVELGGKTVNEYRYGDEWLRERKGDKTPNSERTVTVGGTKVKEYLYDSTRPTFPAVRQYLGDGGSGTAWLKLWQDMVWGVPRGVNTTRVPFEVVGGWDRKRPKESRRVAKRPSPEGAAAWVALVSWQTANDNQKPVPVAPLDGKLWLGAQDKSAEQLGFKGFAHLNLLLHFWVNAVLIYVPQTFKPERKNNKLVAKRRYDGFALAIPDVADLKQFVARFREVLSALGREKVREGVRPTSAVIEVAAQGALSLADRDLAAGVVTERAAAGETEFSISGIDYLHFRPGKNGPRMLSAGRLTLRKNLAGQYRDIVGPPGGEPPYRNPLFRRGLLLALIDGTAWYQPFVKLLTEWPAEFFVCSSGSPAKMSWFWADVRKKFHLMEKNMSEAPWSAELNDDVGVIVLRIVRRYLDERVHASTGNDPRGYWKEKKAQTQSMLDDRKRFAQDLFMQFRSRREEDFVALFRDKLLPCGHRLKDEDTLCLHRALARQSEAVKTLTMLALSANSYVPAPKSNKETAQ